MRPNRRAGRPPATIALATLIGVCITTGPAVAQRDDAPPSQLDAVALTNAELRGVLDFEPEVRDENGDIIRTGTTGFRLMLPNLAAASILNRLDIDGDGIPDNSPDTDGDGLPDNWEIGGFEALTADGARIDRLVFFPAPSPIVPGTPPTPIFTRLAVATSALNPDTDNDGISDFIEVFGLMFIDENRNGLLDSAGAAPEWNDRNFDGLPSPGEFPFDNSARPGETNPFALLHDFDGFVFTDPTNDDTDGDAIRDGADNDPLINPRAFGNTNNIIVRFNAIGVADIDFDGLGNGMDLGNDLIAADGPGVLDFQVIDNPENIGSLLDFFRQDLLEEDPPIVPESAIEDLLGADWDGNGLWRTTDVRTWSIIIDPNVPGTVPPAADFIIEGVKLYAEQTLEDIQTLFNDDTYARYGGRGIGLGWQDLLEPSGLTTFIPDRRVWAILYAWRLPGFDIDGDGFIGVPNLSSTVTTFVGDEGNQEIAAIGLAPAPDGRFMVSGGVEAITDTGRPFDDRIPIGGEVPQPGQEQDFALDGRIDPPAGFPAVPVRGCGTMGFLTLLIATIGMIIPRFWRT
jgi:hypothetical protein